MQEVVRTQRASDPHPRGFVASGVGAQATSSTAFPDLATREGSERLGGLLEREAVRDGGLELACLPPVEEHLEVLLIRRGLARREGAPKDTDDRAPLEKEQICLRARDGAAREADDEQTSLPRDAAKRLLEDVAADRVVHDVRAAAGDRFDRVLPVGARPVVHDLLDAVEFLQASELFVVTAGRHDARAEVLADLDRGRSHPARGAVHQEPFARTEMRALHERVHGRAVRRGKHGPDLVRHALRHLQGSVAVDHDLLGEAVPPTHANHVIASREALRLCSHLDDVTRDLTPRRERKRRLELVLVLDDEKVGKVDSRSAHADANVARVK